MHRHPKITPFKHAASQQPEDLAQLLSAFHHLPGLRLVEHLRERVVELRPEADGGVRIVLRLEPGSSPTAAAYDGASPGAIRTHLVVCATRGLTHDEALQAFFLRGQRLRLRRKEYELLAFFARHPRQLLTHDQILTAVWGEAYESNVLHATLRRLRQALRKSLGEAADTLIEVERGAGFRFMVASPRARPALSASGTPAVGEL